MARNCVQPELFEDCSLMHKLATEKNSKETSPCRILQAEGAAPLLFICDHASRYIPSSYSDLGLGEADLCRHIAWDIGAAALTEKLSAALDAPAVLAGFSRLLIDTNRCSDAPGLIPDVSDGTAIPGNRHIDATERQHRRDRFYHPFHAAVAGLVSSFQARGVVPLVVGVHSFTPVMNGAARPWQVGLLWDKDPRLAAALIAGLGLRPGLVVGDNEPYTGKALFHTMQVHGARWGFPQVTIEIRQDEIDSDAGVAEWAEVLTEELRRIMKLPEMQVARQY